MFVVEREKEEAEAGHAGEFVVEPGLYHIMYVVASRWRIPVGTLRYCAAALGEELPASSCSG